MKASRVVAVLAASAAAAGLAPAIAQAVSGHFVNSGANAAECTDDGLTVSCDGKVAGLGGTTFEITIDAVGIADVQCKNPSENGKFVPGQATEVATSGTTGEQPTPRNGQFEFDVSTLDPEPLPPTPTCPNDAWTPHIVDVAFTTATLTLFEDGVQVDQIVVPVS
jgi:hypothetical protein